MNVKLFLFLATLFLFSSCEKEETWCEDSTNSACPNFDPCFLLSPAVSPELMKYLSKVLGKYLVILYLMVITELWCNVY